MKLPTNIIDIIISEISSMEDYEFILNQFVNNMLCYSIVCEEFRLNLISILLSYFGDAVRSGAIMRFLFRLAKNEKYNDMFYKHYKYIYDSIEPEADFKSVFNTALHNSNFTLIAFLINISSNIAYESAALCGKNPIIQQALASQTHKFNMHEFVSWLLKFCDFMIRGDRLFPILEDYFEHTSYLEYAKYCSEEFDPDLFISVYNESVKTHRVFYFMKHLLYSNDVLEIGINKLQRKQLAVLALSYEDHFIHLSNKPLPDEKHVRVWKVNFKIMLQFNRNLSKCN